MAETKKPTLSFKNQVSIGLRPEKTKTFIEKSILIDLRPKNKHFHWKTSRVLKSLHNQMKKVHSTVFHNAWKPKNKHSLWKIHFQ